MAAALGTVAVAVAVPAGDDVHETVTDMSGDVAVALILVTLLGGPVLAALGRPARGHVPWRRDIGVGGGLLALAHVVCGSRIHFDGALLEYVVPRGDPRFPGANLTGLAAALVLAVVVAVSNGAALRRLGFRRWKRLQALVLPALGLIVAHVVLYASVNGRVLVASVIAVLATAVLVARRRAVPHRPATG